MYDLEPLRKRASELIDFDHLNLGSIRLTVCTTDIITGEMVFFDTSKGDRITIDHLLASCGFVPDFSPVEIGGRMLGDGGLSANAPFEAIAQEQIKQDLTCFVLDLFSRDGAMPATLEQSLARKNDLIFANQTWVQLRSCQRQHALLAAVSPASVNASNLY